MAETIEREETWEQIQEDLSVPLGQKLDVEIRANPTMTGTKKFGEYDTLEEWNAAFTEWIESHDATLPPLSEEAMSRESIYEGR